MKTVAVSLEAINKILNCGKNKFMLENEDGKEENTFARMIINM